MADYGSTNLGYSAGVQRVENVGAVIAVTMSADTAIFASGDVIADTQEIANAVPQSGGCAMLDSVVVIDESDQGAAFDIYILSSNVVIGTENAQPSISDGDASSILAIIPIAAADWKDLGGVRVANLGSLRRVVQAAAGSQSLWIAIVNGSGTPTYAASAIKIRLGLR